MEKKDEQNMEGAKHGEERRAKHGAKHGARKRVKYSNKYDISNNLPIT